MLRDNVIDNFSGEYKFLSNFYPCTFSYRSMSWASAEHAYQAMKATKVEDLELIRLANSPGMAKRLGRCITVREDWERVKDEFMSHIVYAKFSQNPELKAKLLATGDATLIEGNNWGDKYWGVVYPENVGQNKLGGILHSVRRDLAKAP